ncbi:amidohydrolase family protein [Puia sp. P3]|uniref:amidohydrolase family protein n=1 Tax=Puia sp. P3 TaxID=3423952 RepID=UPI003D6723AC
MLYRKFKADYLFNGKEMEAGDRVLITTDEGVVQDIVPAAEAGGDTEVFQGVLSPGFVNCHCHLELSHMKGVLPEGTGLVDFLMAVIRRRGATRPDGVTAVTGGETRGLTREEAMAAAEQEMLDNGIVAVGDICNTADTLALKTEGRLFYHNFIETMGFIGATAEQRFGQGLEVFHAFAEGYALPIEANSIVPHAPYSVSPALFGLVAGFPGNHLLTIHNQESEEENEFYLSGTGDFLRLYQQLGLDVSFFAGTGRRSLESYVGNFFRNQHLILVHNVATREEDVLAARKVGGLRGRVPLPCSIVFVPMPTSISAGSFPMWRCS